MSDKVYFLSDDANESIDSFSVHSKISEELFDMITETDIGKNSFTFGLFGKWGSGKSFIINKLKNKISSNNQNVNYIYIDVWKFNGRNLLRNILIEIDKYFIEKFEHKGTDTKDIKEKKKEQFKEYKNKLSDVLNDEKITILDSLYHKEIQEKEQEITDEEIKKNTKWYVYVIVSLTILSLIAIIVNFFYESKYELLISNILTIVLMFVSFSGIKEIYSGEIKKYLKDVITRKKERKFIKHPKYHPEEFEEIFKVMMNNNSKNIIVFDNIDRCEAKFAYKVLSTLKTYMDIKNCFYIIPCDDEAVLNYLENNTTYKDRDYAKEFIDKIFQSYIRIPKLQQTDMDKFIQEQFNKIKGISTEINQENLEKIRAILYYAYNGLTPREVKRFLNDFTIYYRLASNIDKGTSKEDEKLLNNIVLFTIMISIKQIFKEFEEEIISNPKIFNQIIDNNQVITTYSKEENKRNKLNKFINNIKFLIKNDNDILKYIYFVNDDKKRDIFNKLINAEIIEDIDVLAFSLIEKNINELSKNNIYFYNILKSLYKTIDKLIIVNNSQVIQILSELFIKTLFEAIIDRNKLIIELFNEFNSYTTFLEITKYTNNVNYKHIGQFVFNNFESNNGSMNLFIGEFIRTTNINILNDFENYYKSNMNGSLELLDIFIKRRSNNDFVKNIDISYIFRDIFSNSIQSKILNIFFEHQDLLKDSYKYNIATVIYKLIKSEDDIVNKYFSTEKDCRYFFKILEIVDLKFFKENHNNFENYFKKIENIILLKHKYLIIEYLSIMIKNYSSIILKSSQKLIKENLYSLIRILDKDVFILIKEFKIDFFYDIVNQNGIIIELLKIFIKNEKYEYIKIIFSKIININELKSDLDLKKLFKDNINNINNNINDKDIINNINNIIK